MIIWSPEAIYSPALTSPILAGSAWQIFYLVLPPHLLMRQHHDHQSECLGHRTKLEFFASPPPSENLSHGPSLLPVLARDDQELQELCATARVLEARPVD
ncbi:hypothetical protein BYT27DRAFT_7259054 [Phlegmacium glaucopus]|nr:hypothetical protein BYT27DRAFT_7259054 [Phlegmacium glaucopus]